MKLSLCFCSRCVRLKGTFDHGLITRYYATSTFTHSQFRLGFERFLQVAVTETVCFPLFLSGKILFFGMAGNVVGSLYFQVAERYAELVFSIFCLLFIA